MSELNRYSTSAGGALQNASGYFPEGQAPSTVNDAARTFMADVRRQHQAWSAEKTATYSAGTYSVTYDREVTSGEVNGIWTFIAGAANTSGSAKLAINGLTALDIVTPNGHLSASAIDQHQVCMVAYNAKNANFELVSNQRFPVPQYTTEYTTTGGTNFEFTGIPDWCNAIDIIVRAFSGSTSFSIYMNLGTASAYVTSGYDAVGWSTRAGAPGGSSTTEFFLSAVGIAGDGYRGLGRLRRVPGGHGWVLEGSIQSGTSDLSNFSGYVSLASALTRIKFSISVGTIDLCGVSLRYYP